MADAQMRQMVSGIPVPDFEETAFTKPPPLREATVAIVTTAGLHRPGDAGWKAGDQTFREIGANDRDVRLGHWSPNFDRSGLAADLNVVFPIDRLHEMASEGLIGSVAPRHLSFMGALDETMTTIRIDSGPAAAKLLREDGVDVVLLTPV